MTKTNIDDIKLVTFWHGGALPRLHRECLKTWLKLDYSITIYSYEPLVEMFKGVQVRDASEILPLNSASRLRNWAAVADIIRLILLLVPNNVWVDTDLCLLRRIPSEKGFLLGYQRNGKTCNAIMRLWKEHHIADLVLTHFYEGSLGPWTHKKPRIKKWLSDFLGTDFNFKKLPNSHWGSHALDYYVRENELSRLLLPQKAFYPEETYSGALFTDRPFEHIICDNEIFGLHFFFKSADFENPQKGSFYEWLIQHNAIS